MRLFLFERPILWPGVIFLAFLATVGALSGQDTIPLDSPLWEHLDSELTEIGGRPALMGTAILAEADFQDGVIEFDLYVTGERSYPGVYFRLQDMRDGERFYLRPHRAGLYPDAVQYTAHLNGISGWQLYSGPGYTAATTLPERTWFPVRIEVKGRQARLFLDGSPEPVLVVNHMAGPTEAGALALSGPRDGTAYFSKFRFEKRSDLSFDPPSPLTPPQGMIKNWWVTAPYPAERVNRDDYPNFYGIFLSDWEQVEGDGRGLVDIARRTPRVNEGGDLVLARHIFWSDVDRTMALDLGYSDEVDIFFNGQRLFRGRSQYQQRDPSFLGIVGLFDQVPVQVKRGLNEIFLMVTETFGGWGFMVRADTELASKPVDHSRTRELWATPDTFLTPETVLKDPEREFLYVSNFDNEYETKEGPSGFISRLAMDGTILDLRWVNDLHAPTGMDIWRDTLYVAERESLLAIDLTTGQVTGRWPFPDPVFPNDLVIDDQGTVYISDTRTGDWAESRIYRFRDGAFDILANEGISRANGLWIHDGSMLVGSSGDGYLKRVDLETGVVETILSLGAGIIDGLRVDRNGNILVSHWEGQLYRISPEGELLEILDALPLGWNVADFEYLPDQDLLLIPTFVDNRVRAVELLSG